VTIASQYVRGKGAPYVIFAPTQGGAYIAGIAFKASTATTSVSSHTPNQVVATVTTVVSYS